MAIYNYSMNYHNQAEKFIPAIRVLSGRNLPFVPGLSGQKIPVSGQGFSNYLFCFSSRPALLSNILSAKRLALYDKNITTGQLKSHKMLVK